MEKDGNTEDKKEKVYERCGRRQTETRPRTNLQDGQNSRTEKKNPSVRKSEEKERAPYRERRKKNKRDDDERASKVRREDNKQLRR